MEHVLLSMCCDAAVIAKGKTTRYYVCTACGEPCDAYQIEKSVDDAPADKMVRKGGKTRKKAF